MVDLGERVDLDLGLGAGLSCLDLGLGTGLDCLDLGLRSGLKR